MIKLEIYIADDCWSCEETQRIVRDVAPQFPDVSIVMLDTAEAVLPEGVFAVPTYVLNDRVIFLGNPTREALCDKLLLAQGKIEIPTSR